MKKARKLTAVLLSLVMLLALVVPASAAENYSITIHNDKTGHTYEAYQIFAGTVSSDEETNGETGGPMLGGITWGSGVNDASHAELLAALKADATIGALEGMQDAADATAVAAALDGANAETAAAFADVVSRFLSDTATESTAGEGVYTIDNLDAGYYLVKDQDGSLQGAADTATDYIVQVLGNVAMEPKDSDIPTLEKKVAEQGKGNEGKYDLDGGYGTHYNDVADWNIGDRVPFKLIGSIPDMDAYDTYQYIFHDTISAGLRLDMGSFDVYVAQEKNQDPVALGWTEIDPENYTLTPTADGFTLTIDNLKNFPYVNEEERKYILVFYDAVLNENAEIGLPGNENTAYLEFSNDPNGDGLGRTAEDTVIVFTYELDGTKVDGEDETTKLEGAQFVLLNGAKSEAAMVVDGKVTGWVKVHSEAAAGDVKMPETYEEWVERYGNQNVILTSAADGIFKIAGLDDGTYYLREIQAPNGYNLLEEDVQLVITADTENGQNWAGEPGQALTALNIRVNDGELQPGNTETGIVNVTVANNQGATLPETGGMGTTLFYIIGGLLVVGAGVLLVVRIRMKAHNE